MAKPRFRTAADIAKAIRKAGGLCQISFKIGHADDQRLGHLRKICGSKGHNQAATHIHLFFNYPASDQKFYRETLSKFSQQYKPFGLDIGRPFPKPYTTLKGVGLELSSPTQKKLCSELSNAFKDVSELHNSRLHLDNRRDPRLSLSIASRLSPEAAKETFKIATENFRKGPRSITIVGLSMRDRPYEPRDGYPPGFEFPPWEDFLFPGVDEDV